MTAAALARLNEIRAWQLAAGRLPVPVTQWATTAPCRTCRRVPGVHAGECPECFTVGIELEKRWEQ